MVTRYMWLRQFAGVLNTQLAPMLYGYDNLPVQKLQLALLQCGYGNTLATAIRWRKNMQLAGLLATSISWCDASIPHPMAVQCLGFTLDGWQCECCTQCWWCNALMLHPIVDGATLRLQYCA